MVYLSVRNAFAALAALSGLRAALSAPLEVAVSNSSAAVELVPRATPAPPHFVIYSDKFVSGLTGPPPVSQIKGYNVFALSFLLTEGAFDKAAEWTQLSASQRSTIKSQYAAAGIKLIVSLFGATDAPTSSGADPIATANTMAAWVKQFDLDGVDVDYEIGGKLISITEPSDSLLLRRISTQSMLETGRLRLGWHPSRNNCVLNFLKFGGGAYLKVHQTVGSLIDWYNLQFYNQGTSEYTTCAGLLTASSNTWPNSALFQIAASGVPLSKLVIGKPATASDASNGFMSTTTLAQCVQQAKNQGWNAGVMVWEFPDAAASWIQSVRSLAFPV